MTGRASRAAACLACPAVSEKGLSLRAGGAFRLDPKAAGHVLTGGGHMDSAP